MFTRRPHGGMSSLREGPAPIVARLPPATRREREGVPPTMKLGKILGFEIRLDLSWFFVLALITMTLAAGGFPHRFPVEAATPGLPLALLGALLLFGSVLAHELGHSVVARRFGLHIEGITLFIFGGVARLKDEPRRPAVEFWLTLAGPAVSAALALGFYGLGRAGLASGWPAAIVAMLGYLSLANQVLAIFNMVPAFPLDGGRILRSLLWAWRKDAVVATRWAAGVSRGIALALMALGGLGVLAGHVMGLWQVFIGMFILSAATAAYEQTALRQRLEGIPVSSLLGGAARTIPAEMPLSIAVERYLASEPGRALPVEDHGAIRGVLSMEDAAAIPHRQWPWTTALEACLPIEADDSIEDGADAWQALTQMLAANARTLLVLRDGRVRGVLTRDRMMRLIGAGRPMA